MDREGGIGSLWDLLWDTGKNMVGLYTTQHGMLRGGTKAGERRDQRNFNGKEQLCRRYRGKGLEGAGCV